MSGATDASLADLMTTLFGDETVDAGGEMPFATTALPLSDDAMEIIIPNGDVQDAVTVRASRPKTSQHRRPEVVGAPPVPAYDRHREQYIAWCGERIRAEAGDASRIAQELRTRMRLKQARLLDAARLHAMMAIRHAWLEELRRRCGAEAVADARALAALPGIARIEPTDAGWRIVTMTLAVRTAKERRLLGKLELHLAADGRMRIFNQTHRVLVGRVRWDHPAVRDGVLLAPPELVTHAAHMIGEGQFARCAHTVLAFLTNVRYSASWSIPITYWPEARAPAYASAEGAGDNNAFKRVIQ